MTEKKSGLHQLFEAAILESRFPRQSSGLFRPSEASAIEQTKAGPIVRGGCARKTWLRLKGVKPTNSGILGHQMQRMNVGKEVENSVIEDCKKSGLYVANNVVFRVEMDGVPIAGEIDAVLRTAPCSGEKYCMECKSVYGYYAQKEIFGKFLKMGKEPGKPKDSHLMQLALYLNHYSRLPKDDPGYLAFGALFICDRGDGHFGVFDVWLEPDTMILGEGEEITTHRIFYSSEVLGVLRTACPWTVEDILSRYRGVQDLLSGDAPPPKDFLREYNAEQIEQRHEIGMISDSAYKKWKSSHGPRGKGKEKLGDWNCQRLYCPYSDFCWGEPE